MIRRLAVILAMSLFGLATGCGEDEAERAPTLDGVYRPNQAGTIGAIAFSGGKNYLLMTDGCRERACTEIGTFGLDLAHDRLVLTDARTGSTRTLPIRVLKVQRNGGGGSILGTRSFGLRPLAGLTGGSGQLTDGKGKLTDDSGKLTDDSGKLLEAVGTLLASVIQNANMGGQDVNRDEDDNKDDDNKDDDNKDDDANEQGADKDPAKATQNGGGTGQNDGAPQNGGGDGAPQNGAGGDGAPQNGGDIAGAATEGTKPTDNEPPKNPDGAINCKTDFPTPETSEAAAAAYWQKCPNGVR